MTWTLRRRLVATVVALLALTASVIGVVSTLSLRANLYDQLDRRVLDANQRGVGLGRPGQGTGQAGAGQVPAPTPSAGATAPPAFNRPGSELGMVVVESRAGSTVSGYVDESGTIGQLTSAQLATLLAVPTDGAVHSVQLDGLGSYRAAAASPERDWTQVTALPTSQVQSLLRTFVVRELLAAGLGVVLVGFAAHWLVGRELRPLVRVSATATRVSELPLSQGAGRIAERVDEADTDPRTEVGQVGSAVNRMLGHVEAALGARHEQEQQTRQFVADASHELRTPLASIRGYAELVRRSPETLPEEARYALDRVEAETVRMTALVSDMLLLARLDAGRPLVSEPVDLAGLVVEAVADAHAAGSDHDWRLDLPGGGADDALPAALGAALTDDPPSADGLADADLADDEVDDDELAEPLEVLGDADRLRQVLVNLLSNARLHTPPGTRVTASVRREGDRVVVRVHDDGPGIAPALQARLFDRFTRGDVSRNRTAGTSSTGLGMAIAQAVVHAHGGTVEVTSRPGDTTFTVRLPAV